MTAPSYNLSPGRVVARKYQVVSQVGTAREGELYRIAECATGIERTGKFFYPQMNPNNRVATYYAKKLHRFRHCNILMQYRTQETVRLNGREVAVLVSDSLPGAFLTDFLAERPGRRMMTLEALHLLHALAKGVEPMHAVGEPHGHLTLDNVIVSRQGLGFSVKLVDLLPAAGKSAALIKADVYAMLKIFYEAIGGARYYASQPVAVKGLVLGLRKNAIEERFRDAGDLRIHLESMQWDHR